MHAKQRNFIVCLLLLSISISACGLRKPSAMPQLAPAETDTVSNTGEMTFEGHWKADFHLVINTLTQETDLQSMNVLFYIQQQGDRVTGSIIGREPFGDLSGLVDETGVFRGTLQLDDDVKWESLTMRYSPDGTSLVGSAVLQVSPDEWEFYIIDLQPSEY
jgi:hypothetical protein